jgi:protein-disulfide isomerase/uncharacterized membrane protein
MRKTRFLLVLFGLVALVASAASLNVHYHLIQNPAYTSFCDVSATVSCEAVYQSVYGTIRGVPVAAGGVIWSVLVLLLTYYGMRHVRSESAANVAEYVFVLSVIGLAVVLYFGYVSYFILHKVCMLCAATYVGVFGVFFVAAGATSMPVRTLPARLLRDLRGLLTSPVAATLGVLWLAGSGSLVAFFPREAPAAPAATEAHAALDGAVAAVQAVAPSPTPVRTLTPAERADFERWYSAQPYTPIAVPSDGARVVIVKFNDYQCPPCRQTFMQYKSVLEKFKTTHPGEVKFVTKDFPLDPKCNSGGPHPSGCEAAAAVRMARLNNRAEAMEEWLFANQPAMTSELVRKGVREVAGVSDFDTRYPSVLEQVKNDIKYGQSLGVNRTPTFFINGHKIEGGLEPQFFEAAINIELARSKAAKP